MPARASARGLTLAVFVGAALALGNLPLARADEPLDRIGHVIVLYEENHSFDNYFGNAFPDAEGVDSAGDAAVQIDKTGRPYATLPQPLADAPAGTTTRAPDPRFPPDLPNGPFLFNDF